MQAVRFCQAGWEKKREMCVFHKKSGSFLSRFSRKLFLFDAQPVLEDETGVVLGEEAH